MATDVVIDGVRYTLEKLSDGSIRVCYPSQQINPMHGPGTLGLILYHVHPCQRNQFDFFNGQLPPNERFLPDDIAASAAQRPWWSLGAGERAGLRD